MTHAAPHLGAPQGFRERRPHEKDKARKTRRAMSKGNPPDRPSDSRTARPPPSNRWAVLLDVSVAVPRSHLAFAEHRAPTASPPSSPALPRPSPPYPHITLCNASNDANVTVSCGAGLQARETAGHRRMCGWIADPRHGHNNRDSSRVGVPGRAGRGGAPNRALSRRRLARRGIARPADSRRAAEQRGGRKSAPAALDGRMPRRLETIREAAAARGDACTKRSRAKQYDPSTTETACEGGRNVIRRRPDLVAGARNAASSVPRDGRLRPGRIRGLAGSPHTSVSKLC